MAKEKVHRKKKNGENETTATSTTIQHRQQQQNHFQRSLEVELEKLTVELETVRGERDKQRQQIEELREDADTLSYQKEQRLKRNHLMKQMEDLEETVTEKEGEKQQAIDELEVTRTQFWQLRHKLELLQSDIQTIIDKSASKSTSQQQVDKNYQKQNDGNGKEQYQQLLNHILKETDWHNISILPTLPGSGCNDNEDSEADDIEDDMVGGPLFGTRKSTLAGGATTKYQQSTIGQSNHETTTTQPSTRTRTEMSNRTGSQTNRSRSSSRSCGDSRSRTSRSRSLSSRSNNLSKSSRNGGGSGSGPQQRRQSIGASYSNPSNSNLDVPSYFKASRRQSQ